MKSTDKIELAETHALALALKRMRENAVAGNDWRRALYHAMLMAGCWHDLCPSYDKMGEIRKALGLP